MLGSRAVQAATSCVMSGASGRAMRRSSPQCGYRRGTRPVTANDAVTTTVHTDASVAVSAMPVPGQTRVRRYTVLPNVLHYEVASGFPASHRGDAALLFWQAFEGKLGRLLGPTPKALAFFEATMDEEHAICATAADGRLLGLAGYRTYRGGLTVGGRGFRDLVAAYGLLGALWRAPFSTLLERPIQRNTLLMDGICVTEAAQGRGVGKRLLDAIKDEARARNLSQVRLDVVDSNPRARALYEREGFVPGDTHALGVLLRLLFRYQSSTAMVWRAPSGGGGGTRM
jgi:ribosomal protein S18 acetylase RimI-like enzyme